MIIQFQLEAFKVEFETESKERNRLISVTFQDYSLNIIHLIRDHYTLYAKIRVKMQSKSDAFWDDYAGIEKDEIPTLSYQRPTPDETAKNTRNYMDKVTDTFIRRLGIATTILLMLPVFSHAQDTVYTHKLKVPYNGIIDRAGHVKKAWYKTVRLDSGYYIKKENGNLIVNGKEIKEFSQPIK